MLQNLYIRTILTLTCLYREVCLLCSELFILLGIFTRNGMSQKMDVTKENVPAFLYYLGMYHGIPYIIVIFESLKYMSLKKFNLINLQSSWRTGFLDKIIFSYILVLLAVRFYIEMVIWCLFIYFVGCTSLQLAAANGWSQVVQRLLQVVTFKNYLFWKNDNNNHCYSQHLVYVFHYVSLNMFFSIGPQRNQMLI